MTEKRKDIIKRLKERGYNTKIQEFNKNGVKLLGLVFTEILLDKAFII